PGNVRRTVRALEVARLTGRPFSSFAGGWETYEAHRVRAAGISMPGPVLRTRIEARVAEMLERGWLDEVRGLVERGFSSWLTSAQAIGYAELARHLAGDPPLDAARSRSTRRARAGGNARGRCRAGSSPSSGGIRGSGGSRRGRPEPSRSPR